MELVVCDKNGNKRSLRSGLLYSGPTSSAAGGKRIDRTQELPCLPYLYERVGGRILLVGSNTDSVFFIEGGEL